MLKNTLRLLKYLVCLQNGQLLVKTKLTIFTIYIGTYLRSFCLKKYKVKEKISLEDRLNELKISFPVKKLFYETLAFIGLDANEI